MSGGSNPGSPASSKARRKKPKRRSTGVVQLEMEEELDEEDSDAEQQDGAKSKTSTAKVGTGNTIILSAAKVDCTVLFSFLLDSLDAFASKLDFLVED